MNGISNHADILRSEQTAAGPAANSTYALIRNSAERHGDAPALSFFLRTEEQAQPELYSYRELLAAINQTANLFHSLGADKDTVIAYVLPNLPETHFVIWGGQATGIVAAINPLLEPDAIAELLNASGASILVTLAPFPGTDLWDKMCQVIPQVVALKHVLLVNLGEHVRELKPLINMRIQQGQTRTLYDSAAISASAPEKVELHDFTTLLLQQPNESLVSGRDIKPSDISSYFCTGGTTGTPKIATRSHGNEVANAWSANQVFGDSVGPGKTLFCGLPLFHVNAVAVTGLQPFSTGAHVVLGTPQGYRGEKVIERFWEIVATHRINFFSGVPTLYAGLLQVPVGNHDISSLEYGLCGAAPMPKEVFRRFQEVTGLKILEGYGLTEGTCVSTSNPPNGDRRLGSIGLRLPGQQMKAVILDDDGSYLRDGAIDEVGVLAISGPNVFQGYVVAEQNCGLWIDMSDGQRWLNTGDMCRQDRDGYFWLTGRKKELIIRGGHNIDPASIEEPLHRHPQVAAAAAIGRPDAYAGELPVAYVQLKPGSTTSEAELLEYAAQAIGERAAVPRFIRIVESIPLTAVGKVFKPALKRLEIANTLQQSLDQAGLTEIQLDVQDVPGKGITAIVILPRNDMATAVEQVLGQYPFPFELNTTHS